MQAVCISFLILLFSSLLIAKLNFNLEISNFKITFDKNIHMNKKSTRGGKRPNSGRNKSDDTKEPITVYVRKSTINRYGGKLNTREHLYVFLGEKAA